MHPIKEELDQISPSFCAAKWLQVTLRLQNGHNHSCHHPKTHKIPIEEIQKDPAALHNTNFKKKQRKQMLKGKRPKECSYCWKVEDLPGQQTSDRHLKSSESWAKPFLKEISAQKWNQNTRPNYLEVSFSNVCNFKCAYCYPDVSTKWMSEIQQHGPYPTNKPFGSLLYVKKEGTFPIDDKNNPYVDAFWKWFPEVFPQLQVLRVTGGEPLLSKDCLQLLDYVDQNPNPNLHLSVNSNLGVPKEIVSKTVQKIKKLVDEKKVKSAQIYTSLDTWGSQAEYLRWGLDLELWKKNLDTCLENSASIQTVIMVTFNALSVFKFTEFLEFVQEKRRQFGSTPIIDISILHDPGFLNVLTLENEHKAKIQESLNYMKANSQEVGKHGFFDFEIVKLERILEYSKSKIKKSELKRRRIDFVSYFNEYDRRKQTRFLHHFPEFNAVFDKWSLLKKNQFVLRKALRKMTWLAHHHLPRLF